MADNHKPWKVLKTTPLVQSHWYNVAKEQVQLPDGSVIDDFYVVRNVPTICVLPIRKDNKAVFTRQYRHGIKRVMLELPGGCVDPGESSLTAAKRELAEELGLVSRQWHRLLGAYVDPARSDAHVDIYTALDAEFDEKLSPPEFEPEFIDVQQALEQAEELGIISVETILALQTYAAKSGGGPEMR